MAQKCVHKGCGKVFTDDNEPCVYHPGPPQFHEGQKGWTCCKPRVLTFDEFLSIPPCTTGKHSIVDDTPAPPPKSDTELAAAAASAPRLQPSTSSKPNTEIFSTPGPRLPQATAAAPRAPATPAPIESDSDEPSAVPASGASCKRRGCNFTYDGGSREKEECVYHAGSPIFHEGTKGWTCCKGRVLEFDEFMKMRGCKTRNRHCFVGKKKQPQNGALETLTTLRHDFYQTGAAVMASLYLKKIDKTASTIEFVSPTEVRLDLRTSDQKHYAATLPLYGTVDPAKCEFRILGTKLELTLAKADGAGWPVLRSDDRLTGEIIQTGRAGNA